jgi:hypothetical protein
VVAIVLVTIVASAATVVTGIKEVGQLSSCLVLLYVRHHLSFQSKKNLEATSNATGNALPSGRPVQHAPGRCGNHAGTLAKTSFFM